MENLERDLRLQYSAKDHMQFQKLTFVNVSEIDSDCNVLNIMSTSFKDTYIAFEEHRYPS